MNKFLICNHCKNIAEMVEDKQVPVVCCGEKMTEMVANTTEAATEKHIPVLKMDGDQVTVEVGSVSHPMEEKHFIGWVCLETKKGQSLKYLKPGEEPKVSFCVADDEVVAAYGYCNLHGLWKVEA